VLYYLAIQICNGLKSKIRCEILLRPRSTTSTKHHVHEAQRSTKHHVHKTSTKHHVHETPRPKAPHPPFSIQAFTFEKEM
ncbi:8659_t:CDS:1, partial [Gigaspora rosea]